MRHSIYLLLVLTFSSLLVSSQNYYDVKFDFGYYDHPKAIDNDGLDNVFICGWSEDINKENQRAFAIKVDKYGEEIWRINESTTSKFYSLCIMESGNIAIVGSKNNSSYIKVVDSSNGNELWRYHETDSLGCWFGTVQELNNGDSKQLRPVNTKNGEYVPTVYTFDSNSGQLIDKYQHWKLIDPVEFSFKQSPSEFWFGAKDVVVRTNFEGSSLIWTYQASHTAGMDRLSENKLIIVRFDFGNWPYMSFMTQDLLTNDVDGKFVDFYDSDVEVIGSGMLGYSKILITGTSDGQLVLWIYDTDLNLQKERIYPSDSPKTGIDVVGLQSDNIVIMGYETTNPANSSDVFIMKRNAEGAVSYPELPNEEDVVIYPNPVNDRMYVNNPKNLDLEIELVNSIGVVVFKTSSTNNFISTELIPPGYYIALIKHNGIYINKQKLIIQ
ncbi:MAG: T9SS type A sorting domain-containing protein [Chlorobi bacterium]|nr:T9SS type A sorting domain-containing protein [Chlorobiota bacterium]